MERAHDTSGSDAASAPVHPATTEDVAYMIREAADRLESSHAGNEQALTGVARGLRRLAETLRDESASELMAQVERIASEGPSTLITGSVIAGFAVEEGIGPQGAAPATELPAAASLLSDIAASLAATSDDTADVHPVPLVLAAASIAWLLAQPRIGQAADGGMRLPPRPEHHLPASSAVAPGGLGYFMTLSREEGEEIDWGSRNA